MGGSSEEKPHHHGDSHEKRDIYAYPRITETQKVKKAACDCKVITCEAVEEEADALAIRGGRAVAIAEEGPESVGERDCGDVETVRRGSRGAYGEEEEEATENEKWGRCWAREEAPSQMPIHSLLFKFLPFFLCVFLFLGFSFASSLLSSLSIFGFL